MTNLLVPIDQHAATHRLTRSGFDMTECARIARAQKSIETLPSDEMYILPAQRSHFHIGMPTYADNVVNDQSTTAHHSC